MRKDIADRWVAALRSGDYKQGRRRLRTVDNSFCCLGVLCNLHAQDHQEDAAREISRGVYLGQMNFLPNAVVEWAGMKSGSGAVPQDHFVDHVSGVVSGSLAMANDRGASFRDIASFIEKNWRSL